MASNGNRSARGWLFALGGLVAALAIALVVVLVTRDDDSGSSSTAASTPVATSTTTSTTGTNAGVTTTTATHATSTTVALPVITADPETYAMYLFAAWQNGDRTSAANVASPEAVTQMFSVPFSATTPYTFSNCGPAAGSLYCTWNGPGGATLQMTVRTLTGGLPVLVVNVVRQG